MVMKFVVIHEPVLSAVGGGDIQYDSCGRYDYESNNCNYDV